MTATQQHWGRHIAVHFYHQRGIQQTLLGHRFCLSRHDTFVNTDFKRPHQYPIHRHGHSGLDLQNIPDLEVFRGHQLAVGLPENLELAGLVIFLIQIVEANLFLVLNEGSHVSVEQNHEDNAEAVGESFLLGLVDVPV